MRESYGHATHEVAHESPAGHAEAKKIPDTIENRAAYRSMCFKTEGLGEHISGCILHWETLFQVDEDGNKMVDLLTAQVTSPVEPYTSLTTLFA